MKYLINTLRIIVGVIFIISGSIKLNDPFGFSYKLDDYFAPEVLNMPFFVPYSLALAIVICIVEILSGVMLLVGYKKKFTLWLLLAMMVFFAFLTFYSAFFDKVRDCGCFGDAIKFTPWQSFTKDIVLLLLTLPIFFFQEYVQPIGKGNLPLYLTSGALVLCLIGVYIVYNHLPFVDFRPYKIGVHIPTAMAVPNDAPKPVYNYYWKIKEGDQIKEYTTQGRYPDTQGEFVDFTTELVEKGFQPDIVDFDINRNDESFLEEFMQLDKLVLIIAYRIDKADVKAFEKVKPFAEKAMAQGYKVIGLTSTLDEADKVKTAYHLPFDFYLNDGTTLKTVIRSNPGIVVIHKGTIVDKKHYNDIEKVKL
ncbi:hypothetical protein RCZ04_05470 [Capnocytophaga sp. HP1101]